MGFFQCSGQPGWGRGKGRRNALSMAARGGAGARGRVLPGHEAPRRRGQPCADDGGSGEAQDRPQHLTLLVGASARTTASSGRSARCSRSLTTVGRPWASRRSSAAEVSRAVG